MHLTLSDASDVDSSSEFRELAVSAGAIPVGLVRGTRRAPDPRLFVGRGKADEIESVLQSTEAEVVIFDHQLSPSQERNLERVLQCRVLDRTGLILDIFAQRARSFEGKLQVELAQLRHLSTRLVRGWTHLERQKGGIGLRGPGETQLETDRRLLGQRIQQIRRRLTRVASQRAQSRRARRRADLPTVSLVGYTNAGKSTLFNRLTSSHVYAEDQLFATLDPTLRRLALPSGDQLVLADTVGFISALPHELVAAFRSTLQETSEAALLLHVVDAASPERDANIAEVIKVLEQIGAGEVFLIEVFNKIDLLDDFAPRLERDAAGRVSRVWLSANSGAGIDLLLVGLGEFFAQEKVNHQVRLTPHDGRLRSLLYQRGHVIDEKNADDGSSRVTVELARRDFEQLLKQEPNFKQQLLAEEINLD